METTSTITLKKSVASLSLQKLDQKDHNFWVNVNTTL